MKTNDSLPDNLEEYANNPFIARLPPLQGKRDLVDTLAVKPLFHEKERLYPSHLRKHCLLRLGSYFEPLERQILLAERIGMLLRQGYVGRNPLTHNYIRNLHNGVQRIQAKSLKIENFYQVENTGNSFALIGCSGNGKSKATERILRLYPQCIQHNDPFTLVQIVWLKLDCPSKGSPGQLCINFFNAIDELLGTNYLGKYARKGTAVDEMMIHMAHIANLHAIGVLVIDEIQHLNNSKLGPESLLTFLVTLVNTIGIPVLLIGTLSAIPLLQQNFRQARRANGLGSYIWDAMECNRVWDYFVDQLWQYQWTNEFTPLTDEIRKVLYYESQGIIDIVVKLFMLSQMRIISVHELKGGREIITVNLIRKVAKDEFRIVQPMLNALRTRDKLALRKYDDLMPLHIHVNNIMRDALTNSPSDGLINPVNQAIPTAVAGTDTPLENPLQETVLSVLKSLGVADDIAMAVIQEALAQNPSIDPLLMIATISEKLTTSKKSIKPRPQQKKSQNPPDFLIGDLRYFVTKGKEAGKSAHDALAEAGMIKSPLTDLAA